MKYDRFVALDLELNKPRRDIIEVGVVLGAADEPVSAWRVKSWLLKPTQPLSEEVSVLTGITARDLETHSTASLAQVALELQVFLGDDPRRFVNPVTWGAGDRELLQEAFEKEGVVFSGFGRRSLDVKTLCVHEALSRGESPGGGLRSWLAANRLPFEGRQHRAVPDALNTLKLFFHLQARARRLHEWVALARTF